MSHTLNTRVLVYWLVVGTLETFVLFSDCGCIMRKDGSHVDAGVCLHQMFVGALSSEYNRQHDEHL